VIRIRFLCFVLGSFLWPIAAAAQNDGAQTQEQMQRLYRDAKAAGQRGEIEKAYELMLEAFRLRKAPDAAMNLARIEMELGKWRDAAEHFSFGFRHYPADSDPKRYQQNLERLAQAKREIATVKLEVEPPAAHVTAAGKPLGTAAGLPPEIYLEPGTTEIAAALEGYQGAAEVITPGKGETLTVRLSLIAEPAAAPTAEPPHGQRLRATAVPMPPPQEPPRRQRVYWPAYVATGIAGAGLVTGTVFALGAASDRSDRDAVRDRVGPDGCGAGTPHTAQCAEARDLLDGYDRNVLIARAAFITAGVAAVAATIFFISPPRWGRETPVTAIGVGPSGIAVAGHF